MPKITSLLEPVFDLWLGVGLRNQVISHWNCNRKLFSKQPAFPAPPPPAQGTNLETDASVVYPPMGFSQCFGAVHKSESHACQSQCPFIPHMWSAPAVPRQTKTPGECGTVQNAQLIKIRLVKGKRFTFNGTEETLPRVRDEEELKRKIPQRLLLFEWFVGSSFYPEGFYSRPKAFKYYSPSRYVFPWHNLRAYWPFLVWDLTALNLPDV